MKWMAALCTLVVTGGLAQLEVTPDDSAAGAAVASEQQPPSDLLPRIDELPALPSAPNRS